MWCQHSNFSLIANVHDISVSDLNFMGITNLKMCTMNND